jgi:SAM-dependent methyltransferase
MNPEAIQGIKLKYIGVDELHDSVAYSEGKVVKARQPHHDYIDGYLRAEIDKEGSGAIGEYRDALGEPMFEIALTKLGRQGEISILDAGCGTASMLYRFRSKLLSRTLRDPDKIITVGINGVDYSDESSRAQVRDAIKSGDIPYMVANLEEADLSSHTFDIVYCHEVLNHNPSGIAEGAVKNLLTALKPDGILFFNIDIRQKDEFRIFLQTGLERGKYNIYAYEKEYKNKRKRIYVAIRPRNRS